MKMKIPTLLLATVMVFSLCSCGQKPETPSGTQTGPQATAPPATPGGPGAPASVGGGGPLPQVVVQPAGFTMDKAIHPADLASVMGKDGFVYFPEAASQASQGKPIGSFMLKDVPNSKIRFEVRLTDGREGYDKALKFLKGPVEVPGNFWEAASLGDVSEGERTLVRLVGLRGQVCFHITWDPAAYSGQDKTQTSIRLAELLMNSLYATR